MHSSDESWMRQLRRSRSISTDGGTSELLSRAEKADCRFSSLKGRFDRISGLVVRTRTRFRELQETLNEGRHRPSEAKRLRTTLEEQFALLRDAEREHAIYGKLAKVAAVEAFGATFFEVARLKLDTSTFQALFNETRAMLGRRPGAGIVIPRTPEEQVKPDRKRRGRRMHPDEAEVLRAGRIRAGGGTLVWSDERDLETELGHSKSP